MFLTGLLKWILNYLYHVFLPSATQICLDTGQITSQSVLQCFPYWRKYFLPIVLTRRQKSDMYKWYTVTVSKGNAAALCYCYWLWHKWLSKHFVTAGCILQNRGTQSQSKLSVTLQCHLISKLNTDLQISSFSPSTRPGVKMTACFLSPQNWKDSVALRDFI